MGNEELRERQSDGPVRVGYVDESGQSQYLTVALVESVRVGLTLADGRALRFSWQEALQLNTEFACALRDLIANAVGAE